MEGSQSVPSVLTTYALACLQCASGLKDAPLQRCSGCLRVYYCEAECQKANWPHHKRVCKALKTLETQHAEELQAPFQMLRAVSGQGIGKTDLTNDCISSVAGVEMRVLTQQLGRGLNYAEQNLVGWQPRCLACGRSNLIHRVEASSSESQTPPPSLKPCSDCHLAFACNDAHWDVIAKKHKTGPCRDSIDNTKTQCEMNQLILQDLRFSQVMLGAQAGPFRWAPERTVAEWTSLKGAGWSEYEPWVRKECGSGTAADGMLGATLRAATEGLCMPLTALWAMEVLNGGDVSWTKRDVLNIHVLGAAAKEEINGKIFEEILHRLPVVNTLNLVFVGPQLATVGGTQSMTTPMDTCRDCTQKRRKRVHHFHAKPYHVFARGAGYTNPDLAVAFNSGCADEASASWKETIRVLVDRRVPAVFTSYNHDEAHADSRLLESAGAELIPGLGPQRNPWGSWLARMEPNRVDGFYASNAWLAGGFR